MLRPITIILSILFSYSSSAQFNKVVYGHDNRLDVFESSDNFHKELSRSTAAMIHPQKIKTNNNGMSTIHGSTLEYNGICSSEKFSKQMVSAICSGFLVGKNLLATAGHCIVSDYDCSSYRWVFDFKVSSSDQFNVNVPNSSVYKCKRLISRKHTKVDGSIDDWALIELERDVKDRDFLEVRTNGQPAIGAEVLAIGHPSGLPTKIAASATVTSLDKYFFRADVDTYQRNSGSAVLNSKTGVVEGILVRGNNDYVFDTAKSCHVSNVLAQGEKYSESISNISRLSKLIIENR